MAGIKLTFSTPGVIGFLEREARMKGGRILSGWLGSRTGVVSVKLVLADGTRLNCEYGRERKDVASAVGKAILNADRCGWSIITPRAQSGYPVQFFGEAPNTACLEVALPDGAIARSQQFAIRTESRAMLSETNKPLADEISHGSWKPYLIDQFDRPDMSILEVGSRNVVAGRTKDLFKHARHVGFDIYPGDNVDVVGDAHKLSSYFGPDERFDLIFSASVFEHLAMPWLASAEMVKMLKVGGQVFVETHYCYSAHELPWHFFQFSDSALGILFNRSMGIECLKSGVSNPIFGYFTEKAKPYLVGTMVRNLYCHSEFLGRKVDDSIDSFSWGATDISDVVGNTAYPAPKE